MHGRPSKRIGRTADTPAFANSAYLENSSPKNRSATSSAPTRTVERQIAARAPEPLGIALPRVRRPSGSEPRRVPRARHEPADDARSRRCGPSGSTSRRTGSRAPRRSPPNRTGTRVLSHNLMPTVELGRPRTASDGSRTNREFGPPMAPLAPVILRVKPRAEPLVTVLGPVTRDTSCSRSTLFPEPATPVT